MSIRQNRAVRKGINMAERNSQPYRLIHNSVEPTWSVRYRLPEPLPRASVMAEIHRGVQAQKDTPGVPLEKIAQAGLSGVLLGARDDHEARVVKDVIFYTDPSRTYGEREAGESDPHALSIARTNGWVEVHQDGSEFIEWQEDSDADDVVRTVLGRNKDRYGGNSAFTFEEARAMLSPATRFATQGGYHFSGRPTWDQPYGEPAIVLSLDDPGSYGTYDEGQLLGLARDLNQQERFVVETPWGTKVFKLGAPQE